MKHTTLLDTIIFKLKHGECSIYSFEPPFCNFSIEDIDDTLEAYRQHSNYNISKTNGIDDDTNLPFTKWTFNL